MLYSFCAKENNLKGPFSRLKNGKCAARVIVAQYAQKQLNALLARCPNCVRPEKLCYVH